MKKYLDGTLFVEASIYGFCMFIYFGTRFSTVEYLTEAGLTVKRFVHFLLWLLVTAGLIMSRVQRSVSISTISDMDGLLWPVW
jgi:hypothetical protein